MFQETKNVRPAFEPWDKPESDIPPGYQQIKCHLIFDVNMSDKFPQKARSIAGGHMTDTPSTLAYASVVSRDSVRIALPIAALNVIDILSCDIYNTYLTADCRDKIWTCAVPDFGSEIGTIMIFRNALYEFKSSGAAFCVHLDDTLHEIGFLSTKVDPGVW